MTAPDPGVLAALTEAVRAHEYRPSAALAVERCTCGESAVGQPGWHPTHLAATLAPIVAERERAARADEREAAAVRVEDEAACRLYDVYSRRDEIRERARLLAFRAAARVVREGGQP